ncbi:hypothetical protein [Mesorhizobium sp.]|uniref:hypothetical protein n=1 Tax=Mesorhizobium sp. TaxID=1871066 RepID=UPI0025B8531B|nr:hypothetical protein [Mesorhizobium sp.]
MTKLCERAAPLSSETAARIDSATAPESPACDVGIPLAWARNQRTLRPTEAKNKPEATYLALAEISRKTVKPVFRSEWRQNRETERFIISMKPRYRSAWAKMPTA